MKHSFPSSSPRKTINALGSAFGPCFASLLCLIWSADLWADPEASLFQPSASSIRQPQLDASATARATATSLYYRGLILESQGMIDEAIDAFEAAFNKEPSQSRLAFHAAELAGQFRYIDRGIAILQENAEKNFDSPQAALQLSAFLTQYSEGIPSRLEQALQVLQDAHRRFPFDPAILKSIILAYQNRQQSSQAEQILQQALASNSQDPKFWLQMASIAPLIHNLKSEQGLNAVTQIFEKALQFAPADLPIGLRVTQFYQASGQFSQARDLLQDLIAAHPAELALREYLAQIFERLGDPEQMLQTLLELEQIDPERAKTQFLIGKIYQDRDDWPNAAKHYFRALKTTRGTSRQYQITAKMLRWVNRFDDAVNLLERARLHYPEDLALIIEMAFSLNATEDYAESLQYFEQAERLAPAERSELLDDDFYFFFAASTERLGKIQEAEALFRKSITLAPQDQHPGRAARCYNYLGYMWLEQNRNLEEAGELIQQANELVPDSGAYVDSLGWYYFLTKRYPEALQTLLRAQRLLAESDEGDDPVVWDHIAQTYFALGHRDLALENLRKAIAADPANQEFKTRLKSFETDPLPATVSLDFLNATDAVKAD